MWATQTKCVSHTDISQEMLGAPDQGHMTVFRLPVLNSCIQITRPSLASLSYTPAKCHMLLKGPEEELFKDKECGTSLVVQWLRLHFSMHRVWVWSLGGELRSHMPHGQKIKPYNLEGWDREGGSKGRGYMYAYGWFMLRCDRKQQNSVKQLSFNKK